MGQEIQGDYGGGTLTQNPATGVLTWDGQQIIIFRLELINHLFGSIMDVPYFASLLYTAGISAGTDFAIEWLLSATPISGGQQGNELPDALRERSAKYRQLREQMERGSFNAALAEDLQQTTATVRDMLQQWLNRLPLSEIQELWQQMHNLDISGGWGKATLQGGLERDVEHKKASAHISVTSSFIARQENYWSQTEFKGKRVCSFLAGYFLGEARIMLGMNELTCKEERCRNEGKGAECVFMVYTDEALA